MRLPIVLGIAAAAALCGCHGGRPVSQINPLHVAHNAMTDHLMTVNVGALHGSRQWGSSSIGDKKHGVDVAITLQNEPKGATEPAYLGKGNCTKPPSTAWKKLTPVKGGKSKTHVDGVQVGAIKGGRYAVVVDGASGGRPVACGDFTT